MKPLFVLLITFIIAAFTLRLLLQHYNLALSARIALSVMLLFTSVAHFIYNKGMAVMIPNFFPYKMQLVYLTGYIEILAAAGLLIPSLRVSTGWLLILFFLILLPANIDAAIRHIDYQKGTFEGSGLNYLWFRVPLQLLFIAWTYISAIKF